MRALIVCGVIGLAVGLSAYWMPRASEGEPAASVSADAPAKAPTAAVNTPPMPSSDAADAMSPAAPDEAAPEGEAEARVIVDAAPTAPDRGIELVAGGFTRARAVEILRREAELRREMVSHQFTTTGTVQPLGASVPTAVEQQLRREMGDAEYEHYRRALGQSTRVRVGAVESDSVAAHAGIQSGDEILTYAGRRVFSPSDLNALMLQTPEGETVPTTVVREGQTMQLYVTGGALGIAPGRSPE